MLGRNRRAGTGFHQGGDVAVSLCPDGRGPLALEEEGDLTKEAALAQGRDHLGPHDHLNLPLAAKGW